MVKITREFGGYYLFMRGEERIVIVQWADGLWRLISSNFGTIGNPDSNFLNKFNDLVSFLNGS